MKRNFWILLLAISLVTGLSCHRHTGSFDNDEKIHTPIPVDDLKEMVYYHDMMTDIVETVIAQNIDNVSTPSCVQSTPVDTLTTKWNFNAACTLPDGRQYEGEYRIVYNPGNQTYMTLLCGENNDFHLTVDGISFYNTSLIIIEVQPDNNYNVECYAKGILPQSTDKLGIHHSFHLKEVDSGQAQDGSDKRWEIENELFEFSIYRNLISPPLKQFTINETVEKTEKQYACPLAVKGKVKIIDGDFNDFYVDYGNGQCDRKVIFSNEDGDTRTVTVDVP